MSLNSSVHQSINGDSYDNVISLNIAVLSIIVTLAMLSHGRHFEALSAHILVPAPEPRYQRYCMLPQVANKKTGYL